MQRSLSLLLVLPLAALAGDAAFLRRVGEAALERVKHHVVYDGSYRVIPYPGGDVPADRGACTDVVIRVYRALGIDLQKKVHEDMAASFSVYPREFGLKRPDPNIDHRRVPNLRVFFSRHGTSLPPSTRAEDYQPGDLVTWDLGGGLSHIGIVVPKRAAIFSRRYQIVHNIGAGDVMEDVLFQWRITGHYRYFGE